MKPNPSKKAAALLAVTMSTLSFAATAHAKSVCMPANDFGDGIEISTRCDAARFNKVHNLKLGKNGCAAEGQSIDPYSEVKTQIRVETGRVPAPQCEDDDAAFVMVEL